MHVHGLDSPGRHGSGAPGRRVGIARRDEVDRPQRELGRIPSARSSPAEPLTRIRALKYFLGSGEGWYQHQVKHQSVDLRGEEGQQL